MRVLVTGGAGAIGSHLVDALLERGDEVAVLDSFHDFYARELKDRNLAGARGRPGFRGVYECDVRDREAVARACAELKPEGVLHLAARAGVRPSVEQPLAYCDTNVNGTAVVVTEAAAAGAGRLVFASSSTVYGAKADGGAFREDDDTGAPVSPYGATKRAGELLCHALHLQTGMHITCVRYFSAYGPRQRPDLALAHFARCMLRGESIPVLGDGRVERDFTFVGDVADGTLRALDRARGFAIYNLGRGRPVALNDAIALLERELGVRARRRLLPAHRADVPRTWAAIEKAQRELGYAPAVHLEEGVGAYVRWLKEQAG